MRQAMETTREAKSKIKKNFYICFSGIFFSFSAFRAVIDLQTSINIEHGLGPISGAIINGTAVVSSLTIVPLLLKRLGAKKSLILSEIFYLFYMIGNFYAVFATMIPVSFLAGISDALIFPAMSMYSVYFATQYAELGCKSVKEYVNKFAGKFFSIVYLTHVSGNMLSYIVISLGSTGTDATGNNTTTETYNTSRQADGMDFAYCGANDCQDPNVTSMHIDNYVINRKTLYILMSALSLLIIISLIIHIFPTSDVKIHTDRGSCQDETESLEVTNERRKEESVFVLITHMIKSTWRQIKSPKQILLMTVIIYCGMEITIVSSEISRAYVSCMLGVQQVGLANTVFGALATISANLSGKIAAKFGRNLPFAVAFAVDMTAHLVCLKWIPTQDTTWIIYVICGCYGFTAGIWQTLTNAMCVDYFERDGEVAFTVWNMFICTGITIQFGWSTLLCVDQKLYANIAVLCLGVLFYGIAEFKYQQKPRRENSISKDSQTIQAAY